MHQTHWLARIVSTKESIRSLVNVNLFKIVLKYTLSRRFKDVAIRQQLDNPIVMGSIMCDTLRSAGQSKAVNGYDVATTVTKTDGTKTTGKPIRLKFKDY